MPASLEPPQQPVVGENPDSAHWSLNRPAFRAKPRPPGLQRIFPVLEHAPRYLKDYLRPDVVAALTVAAVAIPSGMAYAELAGVSPVAGLYTLLLPAVAYALLGSSRQLVVGAEAVLALLVGDAVAAQAGGDASRYAALAALVALLVGGYFLLARLLRLGWVADYFSRPVLIGYIHGTAIVLIVGQLPKLFGISVDKDGTIREFVAVLQAWSDWSVTTMVLAGLSLAALLLLRRFVPRLPGALLVVVIGIALATIASLESHGIKLVGTVPSGLPSFGLPDVSLNDVVGLAPAAAGIFLVCFADGVLTARSFAGRRGQHVRAQQELTALGGANLAAGLTGAFVVGASGSRTTVNETAGGRTQAVGLFSAATIAVVLLFLTAPVAKIPMACLGAIIVAAAISLIDPGEWSAVATAGRREVAIAAVTTIGVVTLGVLWALAIAVGLSILDTVTRSAKPHDAVLGRVDRLGRYADVSLHPSARVTPSVVVYRLDDRLFFANCNYVTARILEAIEAAPDDTRWLVFDAESVADVDASGIAALQQLVEQLRAQGIAFVIARLKSPLADKFDATGLTALIGPENMAPTVEGAVALCLERSSLTRS
jgi:SulP family sulfate permease